MTLKKEYEQFFVRVMRDPPHRWQGQLGASDQCEDRLIRIPTGFGKTAGVVLPWLFHSVLRGDTSWPRRLILTLPMRVLVEQSEREVRRWIEAADTDVPVHVLMGGSNAGEWHLDVEKPAVLIGTQDMVLSRGLNRGFGAVRPRWPMDFGLLHHDALWVLDEVQLMDVGLATSVQLAQFRRDESSRALRPTYAWWMSATLQPRWLETVDAREHARSLAGSMLSIPAPERSGGLWEVKKRLVRSEDATTPSEIGQLALEAHQPGTLTLVIVNRVQHALDVYDAIEAGLTQGKGAKAKRSADAPEIALVHSRYRGEERRAWDRFLRRDAAVPAQGRIIVATQVVEAGVDLSAHTLVTEIAPWPSLVQRFGRCARYVGETGLVILAGAAPDQEKDAAPYDALAMQAAAKLVAEQAVVDVAPCGLEALEAKLDLGTLEALYPYGPLQLVRRTDLDELFDTAPDLSGADLDVSRYIRSGDERDATLFWRAVEHNERGWAHDELAVREVAAPDRRELCRAPVGEVRAWLKGKVAYVRDYRAGAWQRLSNDELGHRVQPGTEVLVDAAEGGYDLERGWDPKAKMTVPVIPLARDEAITELTGDGEDEDALSELEWQTIGDHVREVGTEVRAIAEALGLPNRLALLLELAGRWHDVGKAHEIFQNAILEEARQKRGEVALGRDLAKAPNKSWRRPSYPERPGFRHELASVLALLALVHRANPLHDGLLGQYTTLLKALGADATVEAEAPIDRNHPLASELCALSGAELNLVAYLVCAHHGKVRCAWTSTAKDQKSGKGAIHGVCEGDVLPELTLGDATLPAMRLSLAPAALGLGLVFGASWVERVASLLHTHGPFTLAFLEAVLRAADMRVSARLGRGAA